MVCSRSPTALWAARPMACRDYWQWGCQCRRVFRRASKVSRPKSCPRAKGVSRPSTRWPQRAPPGRLEPPRAGLEEVRLRLGRDSERSMALPAPTILRTVPEKVCSLKGAFNMSPKFTEDMDNVVVLRELPASSPLRWGGKLCVAGTGLGRAPRPRPSPIPCERKGSVSKDAVGGLLVKCPFQGSATSWVVCSFKVKLVVSCVRPWMAEPAWRGAFPRQSDGGPAPLPRSEAATVAHCGNCSKISGSTSTEETNDLFCPRSQGSAARSHCRSCI